MTKDFQEHNVINIETFRSDHEEANNRMFISAEYMVSNSQIGQVIITSLDTDFFILACFHFIKSFFSCSELWFKTGNANNLRNIVVHNICKKYGLTFCMSFLVVQALTDCDSTLVFTGIGKKTAFKILQAKIGELQSLCDIGCLVEAQINSDTVNDRIKFVIWLYDKTADTNEIVLQIICSKEILS